MSKLKPPFFKRAAGGGIAVKVLLPNGLLRATRNVSQSMGDGVTDLRNQSLAYDGMRHSDKVFRQTNVCTKWM